MRKSQQKHKRLNLIAMQKLKKENKSNGSIEVMITRLITVSSRKAISTFKWMTENPPTGVVWTTSWTHLRKIWERVARPQEVMLSTTWVVAWSHSVDPLEEWLTSSGPLPPWSICLSTFHMRSRRPTLWRWSSCSLASSSYLESSSLW